LKRRPLILISELQWVADAFALLFAGSVPAAGSLSDRFGRNEMLLAGHSVFGVASLAGGANGKPRPADCRAPTVSTDDTSATRALAGHSRGARLTPPPSDRRETP
jgi:hypothetical protein